VGAPAGGAWGGAGAAPCVMSPLSRAAAVGTDSTASTGAGGDDGIAKM
jgi:hypothetical protein